VIVTIDGPAGTGKSTVARHLAETLGFEYLDTGAMYRMIALKTVQTGIDPHDHAAVATLASAAGLDFQDGRALLDGQAVGPELRTAETTLAASLVAQIPAVRELLVRRQRELARRRNIVCEGRDQGTVAFPHAECKFFLTADPGERAKRRQIELTAQGQEVDFDDLLRDQTARDERDAQRSVAPLKPAEDAVIVDTTALSLDEVVTRLQTHIRLRQQAAMAQ
jgi:cytidylate kinase